MNKDDLRSHILNALEEDIQTGDITAKLVDVAEETTANIILREDAVICGLECIESAMHILSTVYKRPMPKITYNYEDGMSVKSGSVIATLVGNARIILTGERTALNYLQTLSGIATRTREYVDIINDSTTLESTVKLLDTRKTIPSLRMMSKYAVKCGGGHNHRIGLYDAYLIKENHLMSCSGIPYAVNLAKEMDPNKFIEVEVETLDELTVALCTEVDRIMLDNFTDTQIKEAITKRNELTPVNGNKIEFEVSGNITQDRLKELKKLDIDYVSTGAITKNISAIDFSMRFEKN